MARRMSTAWLKPTSLDRSLMVDREDEVDEIVDYLRDQIEAGVRSIKYFVTGERGVGKSILTLKALDTLGDLDDLKDRLLLVSVEARSLRYEGALRKVAKQLAHALAGTHDPELIAWSAELSLLADHDRINASQVEETSRTHGARGEVSADGLFIRLKSMLHWSRTQKTGQKIDLVRDVDDQLLREAVSNTLKKIANASDFQVIAFYDDLDQLSTSNDELEAVFKQVLSLQPCITIAHIRRESLPRDLRREFDHGIEVEALTPAVLMKLLRTRHDMAQLGARGIQDKGTWATFKALAAGTGNPYILLRWIQALAYEAPTPVPQGWATRAHLEQVAIRSAIAGAEPIEALRTLAELVDDGTLDGRHVARADLVRTGKALSATTFDRYVRLGLLIPLDRFNATSMYRVDPLLDLMRPSVAARVLESA